MSENPIYLTELMKSIMISNLIAALAELEPAEILEIVDEETIDQVTEKLVKIQDNTSPKDLRTAQRNLIKLLVNDFIKEKEEKTRFQQAIMVGGDNLSGKTTELIRLSQIKQVPILCEHKNVVHAIDVMKKDINFTIPSALDISKGIPKGIGKEIIVENIEAVLSRILGVNVIAASTYMTYKHCVQNVWGDLESRKWE